ncbi:MAG: ATP-binding cassette domain-containing protein, partial [Candidatus Limnocylindrales bacterium]
CRDRETTRWRDPNRTRPNRGRSHPPGPHDRSRADPLIAPATPEATAGPSTAGLALAVRGLRKRYGQRLALDGLDLSVPSGVVYGFLGPNGAGKTTTMRLLTGLIHADGGSIELLGRPFGRRDRRRLFDVGALVESPAFYPYLSGRANLRALAASGARLTNRRVEEVLELVGLKDRGSDKVATYSLGMKQRLGIAGALLNDPRLLLLDEPSNGLDPAGIVAMRDTLRHLASTGKTVFISSHLLAEVRQLADVIGIIAAGKLVREGPIEDLLGGEGRVRVRVEPDEVGRAVAALAPLGVAARVDGSDEGRPSGPASEAGWLAMPVAPGRAAEINRTLAAAGIYASGLESGSDLESLFLELTAAAPGTDPEGQIQAVAGNWQ